MVGRSVPVVVVVAFVSVACPSPPPATHIDDPSETTCPTQGSRECKASEDCGRGLHCTGGRCFADHIGCPCAQPADCGRDAHCAKQTCYGNAAGAPCVATADCGPRAHCTGEVCYANETGMPCSGPTDCGAGSSCVGGSCN
jgi:hypothetical protein